MMLKSLVLSCALMALFLCGCSDAEKEAEIANLTAENARLSAQVQTLKSTLDSLNAAAAEKRKVLSDLDMDVK